MSNKVNKDYEINNKEIEYNTYRQKLKKHLEEQIKDTHYRWWGWIIAFFAGAATGFIFDKLSGFYFYSFLNIFSVDSVIEFISFIFSGIGGCALYAVVVFIRKTQLKKQLRTVELNTIEIYQDEFKEIKDDDFFTRLIGINFKYIEQYYFQTQIQADKSFRLSIKAAVVGLMIIIFGIILMLFEKTIPAYITTSTGVISEFIAAVFFYLYNRTIQKMSDYHKKLVLTQNIALAIKLSDDMESDQRTKAQELIIDRLTTDINKYLIIKND